MQPFLSKPVYTFLFLLLGVVYIIGLFVPLMNNDAAHHADIALHMYLTGDYIRLVDNGVAYLDKPHLLFWLAAASYKFFGVTSFAYKFPSLLFTVLGVYSVYRLGTSLYNNETGKLAALIIASAFAFILSNTDVRMDAILTACIAFAIWQLVDFADSGKTINLVGASAGLAAGFCTKGHIAVFTPAIAIFFYILYRRNWQRLFSWKWLLLALLFALFIMPVVYCYYVQYNQHPEVAVRGHNHINGVLFILWQQSIDRFSGEMGNAGQTDYLFFLHSFLWAFAPWSIITFIAFINRLYTFRRGNKEWLTTGVFAVMLVVISLSHFKLPHYLNITFPVAAVLTASFILEHKENIRWVKRLYIIQLCVAILLVILSIVVNGWAFPAHSILVIAISVVLLVIGWYWINTRQYAPLQKAVLISCIAITHTFFLLNSNFYPALLTYQGGNQLALATKEKVAPQDVYVWNSSNIFAWNFYSTSLVKPFSDSVFSSNKKIWLLSDSSELKDIQKRGYRLGKQYSTPDFHVSRINFKFINPATRTGACSSMFLSEVVGKD